RKIAAIVTIENMLTGLFGVIPGIFLGQLLAKIFISTYASEMFTMDAWIFPETYMLTIVGILLILLLSEIPGIRYINHLDLARVTKERVT
ncbi:MAG: FtsX-like permease family protein, partial [Nitrososphaeria archaeon]|nr:FtsX-like permease family protein [Nitrososphaeria archaeon]NIQ34221.1 FtsX-like permease family protein [Nitrososphaeria archaeon]